MAFGKVTEVDFLCTIATEASVIIDTFGGVYVVRIDRSPSAAPDTFIVRGYDKVRGSGVGATKKSAFYITWSGVVTEANGVIGSGINLQFSVICDTYFELTINQSAGVARTLPIKVQRLV